MSPWLCNTTQLNNNWWYSENNKIDKYYTWDSLLSVENRYFIVEKMLVSPFFKDKFCLLELWVGHSRNAIGHQENSLKKEKPHRNKCSIYFIYLFPLLKKVLLGPFSKVCGEVKSETKMLTCQLSFTTLWNTGRCVYVCVCARAFVCAGVCDSHWFWEFLTFHNFHCEEIERDKRFDCISLNIALSAAVEWLQKEQNAFCIEK